MKEFSCCVKESDMLYRWHEFANGTKHITCHCPQCGKHCGFTPKTKKYIDLITGTYSPKQANPKPIDSLDKLTSKQNASRIRHNNHVCEKCNLPQEENKYSWTEMKNGTMGIKATCGKCGVYLGYVPLTRFYKDLAK